MANSNTIEIRIVAKDDGSYVIQQVGKTAQETTSKIDKAWRDLGAKSDANYDRMRKSAVDSYNAVKNSAESSARDIVRAEQAKNAQIKRLNEEQYGHQTSMLERLKNHWQLYAVAITGSLYAVQKLVGKSISLAMEQEKAEVALAAALRANGEYTEDIIEKNKRFASSIQAVTTYGDEEVLRLMALQKNLGVTAERLEAATKMSIGLAAATGRDVQSMAMYIALAEQGEFTMLRRYIPALRATEDSTEQMRIVTEFAARGFEVAQESAKTFSGGLQQLKNLFGDVQERIGNVIVKNEALLGIMENGKNSLLMWIDIAERWVAANEELIKQKTHEAVEKITKAVQGLYDIYRSLPDGLIGAAGTGILFRILTGSTPVGQVAAVLYLVNTQLVKIGANVGSVVDNYKGMTSSLKNVYDVMVGIRDMEGNLKLFQGGSAGAVSGASRAWLDSDAAAAAERELDKAAAAERERQRQLAAAAEAARLRAEEAAKAIQKISDEWSKLLPDLEKELSLSGLQGLERDLKENALWADSLTKKYDLLPAGLKETALAMIEKVKVARDDTAAMKDQAAAYNEYFKSLQDEVNIVNQYAELEEAMNPVLKKQHEMALRIDLINKRFGAGTVEAEQAIQRMTEFYEQQDQKLLQAGELFSEAAKGIYNSFVGMFEDIFDNGLDGFDGFCQSIYDMFKRLLAQMAALAIARPVIVPIVQEMGAAMGISNSDVSSVLSGLGLGAGVIGGTGESLAFGSAPLSLAAFGATLPLSTVLSGAGLVLIANDLLGGPINHMWDEINDLWGASKENEYSLSELLADTINDTTFSNLGGFDVRAWSLPRTNATADWYGPIADAFARNIEGVQQSFNNYVTALVKPLPEEMRQSILDNLAAQDWAAVLAGLPEMQEGRWGTSAATAALAKIATEYTEALMTNLGDAYANALSNFIGAKGASGFFKDSTAWGMLTSAVQDNVEAAFAEISAQIAGGNIEGGISSLNEISSAISAIGSAMAPISEIIATKDLDEYELRIYNINKQFDEYAATLKEAGVDLGKYTDLEEARAIKLNEIAAQRAAAMEKEAQALENSRRALEIQIMELSGDAAGATAAKREMELSAMSAALQVLQRRIYALQDEQAAAAALATATTNLANAQKQAAATMAAIASQRSAMDIQILQLQGNTAAATAAQREAELAALDESLRPRQELIYALQDQAAADQALAAAQAALTTAQNDLTAAQAKAAQALQDSIIAALQAAVAAAQNALNEANAALSQAEIDLRAAFEAEKSRLTEAYNAELGALNDQLQETKSIVSQLKSNVDKLKSAMRSMTLETEQYIKGQYEAAQVQLLDMLEAARKGDFAGLTQLDNVLDVLTSNEVQKYYVNAVDYQRQFYKTYNSIGELYDIAGKKLTDQEGASELLQQQIDILTLNYHAETAALDKQLNALFGINDSVLSIAEAVDRYADAQAAQAQATNALQAAQRRLDAQTTTSPTSSDINLAALEAAVMAAQMALEAAQANAAATAAAVAAAQAAVESETTTPGTEIGAADQATIDALQAVYALAVAALEAAQSKAASFEPGSFVSGLYQAILGRSADSGGLDYYTAQMQAGTSASRVAAEMFGSGEYAARQIDAASLIDDLYRAVLNREPDEAGLAYWTAQVSAGTTAAEIAARMFASTEYSGIKAVRGFASGGDFGGGWGIFGEVGPELRFTSPSRIYSHDDSKRLLRNDDVVFELRALRSDMEKQNYVIARNTLETSKVLNSWEDEGLPRERVD